MTYYEVLEVTPSASDDVILMAYRTLMKKYNPDTFSGDRAYAERRVAITKKAYRILSDPELRNKYDQYLLDQNKTPPAQRNSPEKKTNSGKYSTSKPKIFRKIPILFLVAILAAVLIRPEEIMGNYFESPENFSNPYTGELPDQVSSVSETTISTTPSADMIIATDSTTTAESIAPEETISNAHIEEPVYALDFINKTTGEVTSKLGFNVIYAGSYSGSNRFYYSNNPNIYFGYVPHDWNHPEFVGDEPISAIWLTGKAKISDNLSADMNKAALDEAVWDTKGVQSVVVDSYYSEIIGDTICQYRIETKTATISYEWYLDTGNGLDYPASDVFIAPKKTGCDQVASNSESKIGYVIESSGGLKIRSGPSTSYDKVGMLAPLDAVTILEIQSDGIRDWGRIDRGWVCMDYIVEGAPPSSSQSTVPQEIISQYHGRWGDRIGQRCTMTVEYQNGNFIFDITWGSSASSTDEWHFVGHYDEVTNIIIYTNGKRTTYESNGTGQQSTHVHYTNGSGYFFISNGYMYWVDDVDDAGYNCEFEQFG